MTYEELEYSVSQHKMMWRWISNNIMSAKKCLNVEELKSQYVKTYEFRVNRGVLSNCGYCYLCFLSHQLDVPRSASCEFCYNCLPFSDPNRGYKISKCLNGLYRDALFEENDYKYQARVAMQIAELEIDMDKAKQIFGIGGQTHDI